MPAGCVLRANKRRSGGMSHRRLGIMSGAGGSHVKVRSHALREGSQSCVGPCESGHSTPIGADAACSTRVHDRYSWAWKEDPLPGCLAVASLVLPLRKVQDVSQSANHARARSGRPALLRVMKGMP